MRLEWTQVKWFRALLLGDARGKSNNWVRTTVKCPTIASRLSARRLHWLQTIAAHPEHHVAVLGALAGDAIWGKPQLTNRLPSDDANPWLCQFWKDIRMAASFSPSLYEIVPRGWCAVLRHEAFLKFKHKRLHTYRDHRPDPHVPRPGAATDTQTCPECNVIFQTAQALRTHIARAHGMHPLRRAILTNQ
eukprot:170515-Heterocapsa_arctica.AAC.1